MKIVVPDQSLRTRVIQPHFNRSRSIFRGPRETNQINLEAEQLRFDLINLRAQLEVIRNNLEGDLEALVNGNIGLSLDAIDVLFGKIQNYQKRVQNLEVKERF